MIGEEKVRHGRKNECWKGRAGVLPPIISPQTACGAGDRPALMNKVTNLSLIKQSEASEDVICEETDKDNGQQTASAKVKLLYITALVPST